MASQSNMPVPPEAFHRPGGLPHGAGIALSLPFAFAFWVFVWILL